MANIRRNSATKSWERVPSAPSKDLLLNANPVGQLGGVVADTGTIDTTEQRSIDAAEEARKAEEARIRGSYEGTMDFLGDQESALRKQLPITEQQITQSYEAEIPGLERARGEALTGLEAQSRDATRAERSGVVSAGNLLRDLMTNVVGARGGAREGLGELVGRDIAQIVGGVRSRAAETITQINQESGRVKEFYNQTLADLESKKQTSLRQARQDFQNELAKINSARRTADRDKAYQRQDALARFTQTAADIRNAGDIERYNLEQWAREKNASLSKAANFAVNSYEQGIQRIAQFQAAADAVGYMPTEEDIAGVIQGAWAPWDKLYGQQRTLGSTTPQQATIGGIDNSGNMSFDSGLGSVLSEGMGTTGSGVQNDLDLSGTSIPYQ